jgi:hypothetical protein
MFGFCQGKKLKGEIFYVFTKKKRWIF